MNSSTRKTGNLFFIFLSIGVAATFALAAAISVTAGAARAKTKGVDVEIPFDGSQLKTPEIKQPLYLQAAGGSLIGADAPDGVKGPCEVDRIDKSGTVSVFAKLPDVGAN